MARKPSVAIVVLALCLAITTLSALALFMGIFSTSGNSPAEPTIVFESVPTPRFTPIATATATPTPTSTSRPAPTPTCTAGDTGFLSPTAQAADTGGDANGFESNPTGAFADAGGVAANINGPDDRHRFYNYGFSVPGGCSVRGIEVRLDWWLDAISGTNSMDVELSWDGGTTWTAAKTDTQETTTEHTVILGGSVDRWERTWSDTEFSNANFRLRITNISGAALIDRDFFLDWVVVKVDYTP